MRIGWASRWRTGGVRDIVAGGLRNGVEAQGGKLGRADQLLKANSDAAAEFTEEGAFLYGDAPNQRRGAVAPATIEFFRRRELCRVACQLLGSQRRCVCACFSAQLARATRRVCRVVELTDSGPAIFALCAGVAEYQRQTDSELEMCA